MQRFFSELQRRKVLRIASGYVVAGWIILQVAVALQTAMLLNASFSSFILALLVIGFPVALVLGWFFDITPEGIKRTPAASGETPPFKPQTTDLILAGVLALVLVVVLFQAVMPRESAPPATTVAANVKPKPEPPALGDKSIAVLPFVNLSSGKEDAFFADGLTEEVLNILARLHGVRVTSRTSSFAFKGKDIGVKEIAKQLAVRHILEGSVRRDGETVRVTAQLIDTTTDAHVWSETYERKLADVFTVQDEIARSIAGALNIEISVSGGASGAPTTNMEAYRLYLQAREQSSSLSDSSMTNGIDLFRRAIKLDPNFAEAYAHMAAFYMGRATFDPDHREEYVQLAQEAIEIALKLKPNFPTGLGVLSSIAARERDWEAADENAKKALELEPSNAFALVTTGVRQISEGYFEEAHKSFERFVQADPLFSFSSLRFLTLAVAEGDNETAEKFAVKLLTIKGLGAYVGNGTLAVIARERGDLDSAIRFTRLAITTRGGLDSLLEPVSKAMRDPSMRSGAIAMVKEATAKHPWFEPEALLILIGATDDALDAMIARAKVPRSSMAGAMIFAWRLVARGQGSNPKLKQLFREMGLVDYWKKHGWPDRCRPKGEDDFECS